MVEQPKYLEMTLSQLKLYVESFQRVMFFCCRISKRRSEGWKRTNLSCEYPSGKRAVSL